MLFPVSRGSDSGFPCRRVNMNDTLSFNLHVQIRYAKWRTASGRAAGRNSSKSQRTNNMNQLKGASETRKASPRRAKVRLGRPPRELAGEVEERILDASRQVFLERGFEGASIDEIAALARAGKPTIYARFRDKRALFTAVMTRDIVARVKQFQVDVPAVGSIEERLADAGLALLRWAIDSDRIGLSRLAIAEVHRFPDLASNISRSTRELSTEVAARFLREIAQSDELGTQPAFTPQRLPTTARSFLDLVVVPILLRALFEQKLEALRPEIGPHVASSVAFFLAACRSGGVV
jgi:AcrR family transcriptional regulator